MTQLSDPCPNCDEPLPPRARFCKECGYDADYEAEPDVGDPDGPSDFDYDRFLESEGLTSSPVARILWALVALAVVAAFAALVARA